MSDHHKVTPADPHAAPYSVREALGWIPCWECRDIPVAGKGQSCAPCVQRRVDQAAYARSMAEVRARVAAGKVRVDPGDVRFWQKERT